MIWFDDGGTANDSLREVAGTETYYINYSNNYMEPLDRWDLKGWEVLQNAVKATLRMAELGRKQFCIFVSEFKRNYVFTRKQMFCKSGHLPRRIRRKRKK